VLLAQSRCKPNDFVESIHVPALILHAQDDTLFDFSNAKNSTAEIEGSVLVAYTLVGISCWGV
jgi:predicted alpha/beta-fold hydrolase